MEFFLYRLKLAYDPQPKLPIGPIVPRHEMLLKLLERALEGESKRGWRVGNKAQIDNRAVYFRIGRSAKTAVDVYRDGAFTEESFDAAPYTHVFLDFYLQLAAVAKKTKVSQNPHNVARQLAGLLTAALDVGDPADSVEAAPIPDTEDFLHELRSASVVTSYWFKVARPNPFVPSDIIRTTQKTVEGVQAERAKLELKGSAMDADTLEDLTRSVAEVGGNAGARLIPGSETKPVQKELQQQPASLVVDGVDTPDQQKELLHKMRELFRQTGSGREPDD